MPNLLERSPISYKPDSKYAVIIDAGSSGSRLYIYEWPDPVEYKRQELINNTAQQSLLPLNLNQSWNKKINPGISSYSKKLDKVWSGHLEELIKHAQGIIPSEDHSSTPIYFLATAGMRLLDDDVQTQLLGKVCSLLKEHTSFYLPECESHVSVIDGETEGLYGWLALNYLLGPSRHYDGGGNHHSYGFMDMGGASAQIAFSPNRTETERHLEDLYDVHLRTLNGEDHSWKVFVSTWLGFGANEARKRLSEYLVLNDASKKPISSPKTGGTTISDPCSPSGYSFNYHQGSNGNTTIVGTGNFDHCLNQLVPLLNKGMPCKDDPCLFNGIHVPAIDFNSDKLVGVSEYWYTANDIFDMGGKYDFTEFSSKAKQFCSLSWDKVKENSEKGLYKDMPRDHLSTACFKAAWIVNILHEGFDVPLESTTNGKVLLELNKRAALDSLEARNIHDFLDPFQSAISIDGVELTWTLGKAMLYASSQVPPSSSNTIEVGYMPAASLSSGSPHYVKGGEKVPIYNSTPSYHRPTFVSSGYLFIFVFIIIFWFAFAYFKSFGHGHYYSPRRVVAFLSYLQGKVRYLTYPIWSLLQRLTGNGKSYIDLSREDDSDRLLEEGLSEELAMKSYPDSPSGSRASFTPRRMKSSGNLGKSTSMVDLDRIPSRVSSRIGMRPEALRPLSSFDIRDEREG